MDKAADQEMALNSIENAKTSRPSVCNAAEVCLVHQDIAAEFLPKLKQRLCDARAAAGLTPVELHLDPRAAAIIEGVPAGPKDFDTEYLDYKMAVGVVDSLQAVSYTHLPGALFGRHPQAHGVGQVFSAGAHPVLLSPAQDGGGAVVAAAQIQGPDALGGVDLVAGHRQTVHVFQGYPHPQPGLYRCLLYTSRCV